jgi:hypothetical protein
MISQPTAATMALLIVPRTGRGMGVKFSQQQEADRRVV